MKRVDKRLDQGRAKLSKKIIVPENKISNRFLIKKLSRKAITSFS